MSARRKLSSITLLALLTMSTCLLSVYPATAETDQTASKLQEANIAVGQAFNAVSAAEKAGANVTGLLNQLNDATDLLAQAENAYRTGDNNTASNNADSVLPIAQEVTTAAQMAKETASVSAQNAFRFTIILSIIVAFAFIGILFLVWRRFRRNYIKNLSEAKPEVSNFEV